MSSIDGWSLVERGGVTVALCDRLRDVPGIGHAFSTRRAGGGQSFDLGVADDARPEIADRRARLGRAAGLPGELAAPRQVHGRRVLRPGDWALADTDPEGDAVVAGRRERASGSPAVRTADCLPILIAEVEGRAVAAVHAGWRGTAAGIARAVVEALARQGVPPVGMLAALGPCIGECCYEVGGEVLEAVSAATGLPERGPRLDLRAANRRLLEASGVPAGAIFEAPWCTLCRPDLFFSHRGDPSGAGRMLNCIGWLP